MRPPFLLPAVLAIACVLPAQESKPQTCTIEHTLRFAPGMDGPEVTMRVAKLASDRLVVAMPAWKPGHYVVEKYWKRVTDLVATDAKGTQLAVSQPTPDAWAIETGGQSAIDIRYLVKTPRAGGIGASTQKDGVRVYNAYEFEGPAVWLYVQGGKDLPQTVRFDLPEGMKVASGMCPTKEPSVFTCPDYDTLADCPFRVGEFEERTFEVAGIAHRIVWSGFDKDQHDRDEVAKRYARIVQAQIEMMGKPPYPFYVFLMTCPGGGGLEHLNSTSIGMQNLSGSGPDDQGQWHHSIWDSVVSHEFFHLWNVKRLRPAALGPFDYTGPCRTKYLWLSEGVTSYYGDLLLVRSGVWNADLYWTETIANEINQLQRNPGRLRMSVAEASRTVWDGPYMGRRNAPDYYNKGQLLGLLLDIEIRDATDNAHSFDDVMRALYAQCMESGKGFADGDVQKTCEKVAKRSFADFFAKYVDGVVELPFKECLAKLGIELVENRTASRPSDSRPARVSYALRIDANAPARAKKMREHMTRRVVE